MLKLFWKEAKGCGSHRAMTLSFSLLTTIGTFIPTPLGGRICDLSELHMVMVLCIFF
jgi:hypothetical protein